MMKAEITQRLVEEHRLILRMIDLLERNARATAEGKYINWQFYLDGVEFIRNFADRFHHAKEEHVLFTALIKSGMPAEHSPVAVMLIEHEEGRGFVRALEQAAREALAGIPGREQAVAENALAFAKLLREHIGKEDGILYPLAERLIPEVARNEVLEGYREAEAAADPGIIARYRAVVEKYEAE